MYNRNNYMNGRNFSPISNKIVVKNLEDALRRYADFDSEMLYIDANENLIYNVYTDFRGGKTYDIYEVNKREQQNDQNVNSDVMNKILDRLEKLDVKVEELYGKHNVEQTATNKQ